MEHYELLYIISASVSEADLPALKEKVKALIVKHEGAITHEENLGKRKLAYPIQDVRHGYYLVYEFDIDKSKINNVNNDVRLTPEVVRHQTIVTIPHHLRKPMPKIEETGTTTSDNAPAQANSEKSAPDSKPVDLQALDNQLDNIIKGDIL